MNCLICGKFISIEQIGQHIFTPDTHFSSEKDEYICKSCQSAQQINQAELLLEDFCANCKAKWPCSCSDPVRACGICAGILSLGECRCDERYLDS